MTITTHAYTRKEAIADGVLVDVTETAKACGLRYPVALTLACWKKCIRAREGVGIPTEVSRLFDVLTFLLFGCIENGEDVPEFLFTQCVVHGNEVEEVTLKAHRGPGDDLETVITVMLQNEN